MARSGGRYDGPLRAILHAFKYEGRRVLAKPLAQLMCEADPDLLNDADAVVPVPLHPWRAWRRGFNQADDLARELGRPVWPALRRIRHGPPQVSLPAARRHANVRDAYALAWTTRITPSARRRLRGAIVVLVDDVMTTGATLGACANVLIDAGVREVRVLTVARAVAGRPAAPDASRRLSTVHRR
jgi:ComF family protein